MKTKTQIIGFLALATLFASSAYAATGDTASGAPTPTVPAAAPIGATDVMPAPTAASVVPTDATGSSSVGEITGLTPIDAQTLTVSLSNVTDVKMPSVPPVEGDSEAKILEEIKVTSIEKAVDNAKKVVINLETPLTEAASYSIISVGENVDASIDFTYAAGILEYTNSTINPSTIGIEKVVVAGPNQLEMYLNQDLTGPATDFKLFEEKKVSNMFFEQGTLNLKLVDNLEVAKDYILILALKDSQGKDVQIENFLYDFTTPAELAAGQTTGSGAVEQMDVSGSGELNAATASGMPIEQVAMQVTQTPNTGATTNVMVLLGLVLAAVVFALRRKSIQS